MMKVLSSLFVFSLLPSLLYGCSHGSVRLYNPQSSSDEVTEGSVQYCYYGTWYSACDVSWACPESNVVCRELGYGKAISYVHNSDSTYGYYGYIRQYYYTCSGSESSLASCSLYSYSYCSYYTSYTAGVRCVTNPNILGNCSESGAVRLIGGTNELEGVVEFCYNNQWTIFCSFDDEEATVACKQLGYQPFARFLSSSEVSWGFNHTYPLTSLSCSSYATQSSLSDCTTNISQPSTCAQVCTSPKAIRCYASTSICTDGAVRLANGSIGQEGRVEVCVNGVWGTVCSSGWSKNDARVICKQLGYIDSEPVISTNAKYGRGDGPIFFSDVNCQGWERSFTVCSKASYLHFNCNSDNSISGTLCTDGCTEGQVRLVGGTTNEGTVEICHNHLWGLVTDAGWDRRDAVVICRQLDQSTEGAVAVTGSHFGKPDRAIHYSFSLCTGSEQTLSSCNKITHSLEEGRTIYSNSQAAGVICQPAPPVPDLVCTDTTPPLPKVSECTAGSFRQVEEGELEYCHGGQWSVLCTFTHKEATVACYQLGHTTFPWGLINEVSTGGSNISFIQNITCNGTTSLNDCVTHNGSCTCNKVIGLKCFEPVGCQEGSVRIVNGLIENEGRLEVCVNRVWGSVCDDGWDKTDAHVVCQQLGFSELEPEAYMGSTFGESIGPIVYSQVRCGGWETSLDECMKTKYIDFTCPRDRIAGALCVDGCTGGDIQLVGSPDKSEGIVQICVDGIWGVISEHDWDTNDATVICHQLGFEGSIARASTYPKQRRAIFLSNVTCTGSESSIGDCDKILHSLDEARYLSQITKGVAGVACIVHHNQTSTVPLVSPSSYLAVTSTATVSARHTAAVTSTAVTSTAVTSTATATVATLAASSGSSDVFMKAILVLVCILILVVIIGSVVIVICVRSGMRRRKILHRPLPAITMSNIDSRYELVQSTEDDDVKTSLSDEEFPTTSQEEPYHVASEKEPLYELAS